jgi:hypothetical protein
LKQYTIPKGFSFVLETPMLFDIGSMSFVFFILLRGSNEPSSMAFDAVGAASQFTVANVVSRSTQASGTRAQGGYASNGFVLFVPLAGGANCMEVCVNSNAIVMVSLSASFESATTLPQYLFHIG